MNKRKDIQGRIGPGMHKELLEISKIRIDKGLDDPLNSRKRASISRLLDGATKAPHWSNVKEWITNSKRLEEVMKKDGEE